MTSSENFEEFVRKLSPRFMLRRILWECLDQCAALPESPLLCCDQFPISPLVADYSGARYESAIAQKLLGSNAPATAGYAQTIVQQLHQCGHALTHQSRHPPQSLAVDMDIAVTPQGWLTLTLSNIGISSWLALITEQVPQRIHDRFSLRFDQPSTLPPSNRVLCDRLHLSLPALLTWAHQRCAIKLRAMEVLDCQENSASSLSRQSGPTNVAPDGAATSPGAHIRLVKSAIHATDSLAARPLQAQTWWRQGYALAEAVYRFDAAWSLTALRSLPPANYNMTCSALRAAHTLLSLILAQTGIQLSCRGNSDA